MATLEKIRSKGVLIIVVIGIALVSFIIGDFFTQGSTVMNQSREKVAEINGRNVKIQEFQDLLDQITIFQKYESGQADIDEQTMQQMRTYVWDQLVREQLITTEATKMGLTVTTEELSEYLIGNTIHPLIQQRRFFADESGQFSRSLLLQFLNHKDEEPTDMQMQEVLSEYRKLWIFLERTVKFAVLQDKFNSLFSKALVANTIEAKRNFDLNNKSIDVDYVVQPYFTIPDSEITVTPKEIRDRYNARQKMFRQEPNVSLKIVSFRIQPSEKDFTDTEAYINNLKEEFSTSSDIIELVNSNSDVPYTGRNFTKTTVPTIYREFAFSGKTGDVFGPVFSNNTFTMARIMETGLMSPDSVKLRHIFLAGEQASKTDSIVRLINAGANFGELAKTYSAVTQTAQMNGEIGWIVDGDPSLDREILNNAFTKNTNEVFTFSNAQGTQIMQIMEKTAPKPKVKLAILERAVTASSITESQIFNEAKRFAAGLRADMFDSIAAKNNYPVRYASEVLKTSDRILNIPQTRQIIRWAFDNKVGSVSDVFECERELIVAVLTDKNESGFRPLSAVSDQLRNEIIRDKKAQLITEQLNQKITNDLTLENIAEAIGQEVSQADNINFGSFQFGLAGSEPAAIGKATTLALNQISTPVKGNAGVYVLSARNITALENVFVPETEKQMLRSRFSFSIPNSIFMDMRDKAEITDNRLTFY